MTKYVKAMPVRSIFDDLLVKSSQDDKKETIIIPQL